MDDDLFGVLDAEHPVKESQASVDCALLLHELMARCGANLLLPELRNFLSRHSRPLPHFEAMDVIDDLAC